MSGEATDRPGPLRLHDYSLTAMATGLAARNARELNERVDRAPTGSLVHHFWGRLLRADSGAGEYGNDLAEWAARCLGDLVLAERLAWVDPLRFSDVEDLRERVSSILEQRLEETETRAPETRPEDSFHFVSDQMVVYDVGEAVDRPEDLPAILDSLSDTGLFLHFVDPPALEIEGELAVTTWLRRFGPRYGDLADDLESIDVFLVSPDELRKRVRETLQRHLEHRPEAGG